MKTYDDTNTAAAADDAMVKKIKQINKFKGPMQCKCMLTCVD